MTNDCCKLCKELIGKDGKLAKTRFNCTFNNCPNGCHQPKPEVKCDGSCKLSLDKQAHFHSFSISGVYLPASTEAWKYMTVRIGMLRQWLNEDRKCEPMVTNEDIIFWLKIEDFIRSHDQQLRQRIVGIIKDKREMYEPAYEEADKAIVETLLELEAFITNLK